MSITLRRGERAVIIHESRITSTRETTTPLQSHKTNLNTDIKHHRHSHRTYSIKHIVCAQLGISRFVENYIIIVIGPWAKSCCGFRVLPFPSSLYTMHVCAMHVYIFVCSLSPYARSGDIRSCR